MTTARLENVADVYVLTPMQQGMLYHSIAERQSAVYLNQIVTRIDGPFDPSLFETSWSQLVKRHPTLRTAFLWDGLDEPLQLVRQQVELPWAHLDWSEEQGERQAKLLDDHLREDRDAGFDLAAAPLMRMTLIEAGDSKWHWIWTFHHLIVDGWSAQVLIRELQEIYRAGGSDDALSPAVRFSEFVAWTEGLDESEAEAFWSNRLQGFKSPHRLDAPGLPPRQDGNGHLRRVFALDRQSSDGLRTAASDMGVTLNALVAGAWGLVLSRRARTRDVVFGMTTSGRPVEIPEMERAVGLFINTIPLRLDVEASRSITEFARATQAEQVSAMRHQHASLASIQHWSDIEPGEPLFESILVYENYPSGAAGFASLSLSDVRHIEQSNYRLALLVVPGETIEIHFVYDSTSLSPEAVESLASQLSVVLDSMARQPAATIADIPTQTHDDQPERSSAREDLDATGDPEPIHATIARVASAQPDALAVLQDGAHLSYLELDRRANALAQRLVDAGVDVGALVGLVVPRSPEMLVGILGIMKAGAAYVPLDPDYPAEHLRRVIHDDGISVVVTDQTMPGLEDGPTIMDINGLGEAAEPPPLDIHPGDVAYMIHTSGSTGRPKGVLVSHANLFYSTMARASHYGDVPDRFLLMSSHSFDSSVAGIFWTLVSGGALILPAPGAEHDLDGLLELARATRPTHLLCLPTLYELMVGHDDGHLASLRVAIVAGEACPPSVVGSHFDKMPDVELHNEYGPTEATVWCTVHRVSPDDRTLPVPIGKPIAGAKTLVVDEAGHSVPSGFIGQLLVGGPGVALGYHGADEQTLERFSTRTVNGESCRFYDTGDLVARRRDGALLFLGRADSQVKVRGHRVEVAAVESALRDCPGVESAAVATRPTQRGNSHRLVGYVVSKPGSPIQGERLRRLLADRIPGFMVPEVLVAVDEIPRLPNGKIDRRRLADNEPHTSDQVEHRGPTDEIEANLALIWSELLGIDEISVDDDYFALGGDSIVSIQMISRARQVGIALEPAQVVQNRTIAQMADAVKSSAGQHRGASQPLTGDVPLSPIQSWFFDLGLEEPSHWNQSRLVELREEPELGALEIAVNACVERHDMLRARFQGIGASRNQIVSPLDRPWLRVVDVSTEGEYREIIESTQASLDLERGPLTNFVLIRSGRGHHLFIAAHHLVTDVVSWTVLLDDLAAAYRQVSSGQDVDLAPRSDSYRQWVDELSAADWGEEVGFWREQLGDGLTAEERSFGTESSRSIAVSRLPASDTDLLLTRANDAYRTRPFELMLAALALAEAERLGTEDVALTLEGHGRALESGIDVSRTIGWFTAIYPLRIQLPANQDGYPKLIAAVKERFREVPNHGLGFGFLKFLEKRPELSGPMPPISFNYVGRAQELDIDDFASVSSVDGSARAAANDRPHEIEIVAGVNRDGELEVHWHFSTDVHQAGKMARAGETFIDRLRDLIAHTMKEMAGSLTPSDFPEAGMSQDELDEFMEGLS